MTDIRAIYADGSCLGNPGSGGWAVVICFVDGSVEERGGHEPYTTSNRMELRAAVEGLKAWHELAPGKEIALYTDSEYVVKGITTWIYKWKLRGWKTIDWKTHELKPVLHRDLWEELEAFNADLVKWNHVRSDRRDPTHKHCASLARCFSRGQTITQLQDFRE